MITIKHSLLFTIIFLFAGQLFASHIVGGGITYECLGNTPGGKMYRFTMKVYRDCNNGQIPADNPAHIAIYEGTYETNTIFNHFEVSVESIRQIGVNEPDCIDNLPDLCLEETVYTWETMLPVSNNSFFVEYQRCCRTAAITNIWNPSNTGATYYIEITPAAQQLCNDSPAFNTFPPLVLCNNYPIEIDYSATDADGDQLVYSFCAPFAGGGMGGGGCASVQPMPPCPPPFDEVIFIDPLYSASEPMGGDPVVQINAQTGLISGTPRLNGQFVVGVCVQEFRNGQLLSVTRRDFQFNVSPCAPEVIATVAHDEITSPQHYVIKRCDGSKSLTIDNQSTPLANISSFDWSFDLGNGDTLENSTDFDLPIEFPDYGIYNGTLVLNHGQDCGDTAYIQVRLYPLAELDLGADIQLCKDSTIVLDAGDDFVSYQWQDGSTLPTFSADSPGLYHVLAIDYCGNLRRDSVLISFTEIPDLELEDLILCPGDSLTVTVPGFVHHVWTPAEGLSCTDCATITVHPDSSTTYHLLATNQLGCTAEASFYAAVLPVPGITRVIYFYPNQPVTLGGQIYTQPDTVILNVASTTGGCDSLNTYILELIPTDLSLTCPPDMTLALPNNSTGVAVNYALPSALTDCPGLEVSIELLSGQLPGTLFPAGLNPVCFAAQDSCGNRDTCCFNIRVTTLDIQCPANMDVILPNGDTTIVVNYPIPTATSDCPDTLITLTLLNGLNSGASFELGSNTVCYEASNTCGNRDTCCFTINVTTLDIVCPPNLVVALPANSSTLNVSYDAPAVINTCSDTLVTLTLIEGLASGSAFPAGVNTVCYEGSNTCGSYDTCCFTVTVTTLDIICPANITVALPNNSTSVPVEYAEPLSTTNCPDTIVTLTLIEGLASGSAFSAGVNTICYEGSNTCGNLDTCCFTVTVTTLDIVCPANITVALPNNSTSIPVEYAEPLSTTNCPDTLVTLTLIEGLASGSAFSAGVNTICYEGTNTCGNLDTCCFTVTVTTLDIVCPANITVALPNNSTSVPVEYAEPTATTDCPDTNIDINLQQGPASGGDFSQGVTNVCYSATNNCGNTATCCFTVTATVLDIQCPANITVQLPAASTTIAVNYPAPTVTTDCPDAATTVTLIQGGASGTALPAGVHTVCYEGANTCGNRDTCCFTITVQNAAPPSACDIKNIGCMRFELLDIRLDSIKQWRYRIKTTNFCASEVDYIAIQLPDGVVAVTPKEGSIYTAPGSGNHYLIRNPNASPFYSIRFRSTGVGLNNGQSDVLEYKLPQQPHPDYIHIGARLRNGDFYEAHLNTFYCPVQPWNGSKDEAKEREDESGIQENVFAEMEQPEIGLRPNPTKGLLLVDLQEWLGQNVQLQIMNAQGQLVLSRQYVVESELLQLNLDAKLANGLYYIVLQPAGGATATARFVLQR